MSRPPRARESVLDAFETILIDEGERGATMDATARAAGVSKGGLLYHFGSKDALEAGLIERLDALVDEDIAAITSAPEGAVAYFLRSSVMHNDPLDRAIIATSRLAQGGNAAASAALREIRERWEDAIRPHIARSGIPRSRDARQRRAVLQQRARRRRRSRVLSPAARISRRSSRWC